MRSSCFLFGIFLGVWLGVSAPLTAAEFHLNNEDIIGGQAVSFNDDGLVVRRDIGGYTPRISWSKLTQETLRQLLNNPQAKPFVEPFIDLPPVPKEKEKEKKEIVLKPVPRVERIEKSNFFASIATPAGLAIFLVLFLANLYAAYEVARYRNRPPALVCGLAVVLPLIAPILFLAMPSGLPSELEAGELTEPAAALAAGKATTGPLAKTPMASGLSIASTADKSGSGAAQVPQVYKRGEFTFNRRFIETKFPSFFRIVQSEADKDLVLVIRTPKDEYVGKRISRITGNEMHLQQLRGTEVTITFAEITEIHLRHKDAKT